MQALQAPQRPLAAARGAPAGPRAAPRAARAPLRVRTRAAQKEKEADEAGFDSCDDNINEYCSIDFEGKKVAPLSLGEKEQLFLEAMAAFYMGDKPAISDAEFDVLKDELLWSGSQVAVLTSDEQRFLECTQAALRGAKPPLTDREYDALKLRLKAAGSQVAIRGPRCSIRSRVMYSDAEVDYLRMVALNVPAAVTVLLALFALDDLTGFEVTQLMELPQPFGILVVWGVVLPAVYVVANAITNLVFKDALVLKTKCPTCGTTNLAFFGDILTVSGNRDTCDVDCPSCKTKLTFNARKREIAVNSCNLPGASP